MATADLSMDELHGGCVMKVRMPRSYSLRMKLGLWLIGLAGRVIHMPTEIEIVRKDGDGYQNASLSSGSKPQSSHPYTHKPKPVPKP